ncbi:MAG: RNA polymerase sigma factor [Opitutus sp.]|nr:RNA polymerase sigma factor [Opitutus sp.]MCS6247910.1 RNA polymerase sigma factor [Opitutus sp.]MCS6275492.1 RNA polymerase sigma factor [Opitutus sp.]MCS6276981.1 RNA polymerase sigma factor [Opitutus sp.]MCS6299971.1 RNA polymerase sigma factor [Opitutus sp.]
MRVETTMSEAGVERNDEELARALSRGEERALDVLMTRWQVPLRAFLYRYLHNEADAFDLAQETFVRVYRHRANYQEGKRFSTWMFQIGLNLARDHARRRVRRPMVALEDAPEAVSEGDPREGTLGAERARAVREAIGELPESLREAVLLFEYEHKSHAEIAAIVGASAKAVETRLHRAREQLRKGLRRFFS